MITKLIKQLLEDDLQALSIAKKRLQRCAEGAIHIRRRKKSVAFYHESKADDEGKRKERHIPKKERRMITSLSTRKYCERLIPILEKEIRVLRSFLKDFNPEEKHLSRNLPPELFPYVDPVVKTNAQLIEEWLQEGYETNGYPIDPKIYRAKKGEYVRSRLELTIANMLYDKQIPYRYECALYLDDGKAVYPDFTILHPETLETYWLEVFGMMDDPDYAASNYQKIARYAQNSMFPKLIMVFDHKDAPFRTETMEQILYNYFLS